MASTRKPTRRTRHGFAMPIVVLLALVVGIVAAMVLARQSAQAYIMERQLRSYEHNHFERGLREVVGAWTNDLVGQPLERMIGPEGHTLDLLFPDGSWGHVYLFDGQGSLIGTPGGLTEAQREDMAGILDELAAITGGEADPAWFRPVGPVRVSLTSAAPEVMEAIAAHAGARTPGRFARSIVDARAGRFELTQPELETAFNEAGLGPEGREIINRLVTLEPELWAMVVEVYRPARPGEMETLTGRYLARFSLPAGGGGRATVPLNALGRFLSWEELPLD